MKNDDILRAALAIHTVEARHASCGSATTTASRRRRQAFDKPRTKKQVLAIVASTGFIV